MTGVKLKAVFENCDAVQRRAWRVLALKHAVVRRKAKVAHCARVAGGSDGKTSSLAVAIRSV